MRTHRRHKKTGEYQAKDTQGKIETIEIVTEFLSVDYLSDEGRHDWIPGMQSHRLKASSNHVNVNSDGTLVEVQTGRVLTRI